MGNTKFYKILGLSKDASKDEIEAAFSNKMADAYVAKNTGQISEEEFYQLFDQLNRAHDGLINSAVPSHGYDYDEDDDYENSKPGKKSGLKKVLAVGAVAAAVTVSIIAGTIIGKHSTGANLSNQVNLADGTAVEDTYQNTPEPGQENDQTSDQTPEQENNQQEESETNNHLPSAIFYGDINDEKLVTERATTLVNELNALKIVNPSTGAPYSVDEVVTLILYANGVYTPETMEEIDVLHLSLLNLLISPLNTDEYLYHVVYASGNDDFKDLAQEAVNNIKPINFGSAFAEYEENGVYPLTKWMQEKREAIYSTTDRETINKIYVEVGQVMADIMKGNGCTITIYEDKEEYTYTFTSEQILANHASAMLLTIDAQLIFANHYEVRDENDKVIDSTQTVWQVYNKFNGEEPDQVSLDEIQAWINNGCDYEWGIEDVLINGQTFGQRIQGDMEGMAQNNYAMHNGQTLSK